MQILIEGGKRQRATLRHFQVGGVLDGEPKALG